MNNMHNEKLCLCHPGTMFLQTNNTVEWWVFAWSQ